MSADAARQQFGRTAADYVQSSVHALGADLQTLVAAARPSPQGIVLDTGTGTGHTALALAPHVRLVIALDLTPQMLAAARRLAAGRGAANVHLVEGAAEQTPLSSRSCHLVTCRVAAHHFANLHLAAVEMARVLRPGAGSSW